jgi:hypothetical protein
LEQWLEEMLTATFGIEIWGLRYYTWFVFLVSVYKLLDTIDVERVMVWFFGALCFSCCFYEDYGRDA